MSKPPPLQSLFRRLQSILSPAPKSSPSTKRIYTNFPTRKQTLSKYLSLLLPENELNAVPPQKTQFNSTLYENDGNLILNYLHSENWYCKSELSDSSFDKTELHERTVLSFDDQTDLDDHKYFEKWILHTDVPFGGSSTATLRRGFSSLETADRYGNPLEMPVRTLIFEGELRNLRAFDSTKAKWTPLSSQRAESDPALMVNTPSGHVPGFCAFVSREYEWPDLNLWDYSFLQIYVKTDGRPYSFNVRCRNREGLIYQARLKAENPTRDYLHKLEIKFENLHSLMNGAMLYGADVIEKDSIKSFGFSVHGPPGPFRLELAFIRAGRGLADYEQIQMRDDEIDDFESNLAINDSHRVRILKSWAASPLKNINIWQAIKQVCFPDPSTKTTLATMLDAVAQRSEIRRQLRDADEAELIEEEMRLERERNKKQTESVETEAQAHSTPTKSQTSSSQTSGPSQSTDITTSSNSLTAPQTKSQLPQFYTDLDGHLCPIDLSTKSIAEQIHLAELMQSEFEQDEWGMLSRPSIGYAAAPIKNRNPKIERQLSQVRKEIEIEKMSFRPTIQQKAEMETEFQTKFGVDLAKARSLSSEEKSKIEQSAPNDPKLIVPDAELPRTRTETERLILEELGEAAPRGSRQHGFWETIEALGPRQELWRFSREQIEADEKLGMSQKEETKQNGKRSMNQEVENDQTCQRVSPVEKKTFFLYQNETSNPNENEKSNSNQNQDITTLFNDPKNMETQINHKQKPNNQHNFSNRKSAENKISGTKRNQNKTTPKQQSGSEFSRSIKKNSEQTNSPSISETTPDENNQKLMQHSGGSKN